MRPWTVLVRPRDDTATQPPNQPNHRMPRRLIADLCVAAGADQDQLQHWVAVGQSTAEHARAVPSTYTGARRRRP